jgi:hypothetical protein
MANVSSRWCVSLNRSAFGLLNPGHLYELTLVRESAAMDSALELQAFMVDEDGEYLSEQSIKPATSAKRVCAPNVLQALPEHVASPRPLPAPLEDLYVNSISTDGSSTFSTGCPKEPTHGDASS